MSSLPNDTNSSTSHTNLPKSVYIWLTVWIIVGNFVGLVIVWCLSPAGCIDFSQIAMWALATFFLGAVLGILFGVPKDVSSSTNDNSKETNNNLKVDTTNLTEISDWLTKIVLGAGLVQLKEMPAFIWKIAGKMALGVSLKPAYYSNGLCAAVIIYHFCLGLLCGYFAMRTIFKQIFDRQANQIAIEGKKTQLLSQLRSIDDPSQAS